MNNKQKLYPKYWVAHDVRTDDVFISTASKSLENSRRLYAMEIGEISNFTKFILVALVMVDI
jgi:hypothetical protein